jgi:hypothetical protein
VDLPTSIVRTAKWYEEEMRNAQWANQTFTPTTFGVNHTIEAKGS